MLPIAAWGRNIRPGAVLSAGNNLCYFNPSLQRLYVCLLTFGCHHYVLGSHDLWSHLLFQNHHGLPGHVHHHGRPDRGLQNHRDLKSYIIGWCWFLPSCMYFASNIVSLLELEILSKSTRMVVTGTNLSRNVAISDKLLFSVYDWLHLNPLVTVALHYLLAEETTLAKSWPFSISMFSGRLFPYVNYLLVRSNYAEKIIINHYKARYPPWPDCRSNPDNGRGLSQKRRRSLLD